MIWLRAARAEGCGICLCRTGDRADNAREMLLIDECSCCHAWIEHIEEIRLAATDGSMFGIALLRLRFLVSQRTASASRSN